VPFDPYVPVVQGGFTTIGRVVAVHAQNPRAFAGAPFVPWGRSNNGIQVFTDQASVWVEYLVRPHRLTGVAYDAGVAYTAVADEDSTGTSVAAAPRIYTGTGSPEGAVTANPGSIYVQQISSTATQTWVKATGTGNTGWVG
jgi:hypothetical protein